MEVIKDPLKDNEVDELVKNNVILTSIETVLNWARSRSLWPLTSGLACCSIEMMCTTDPRFDISRFGYEVFRPSPRQADVLITAGTLTWKMAPAIKRLYEQMAAPKYVVSMGSCSNTGGPFIDSYAVVPGVDNIIPVDVYIPGCPPRPEALIYGFLQLKQRIEKPSIVRLSRYGK